RALARVAELRTEADEIILNAWNEIEDTFSKYSAKLKREKSAEYGVVYVYRKSEKKKMSEGEDDDEIRFEASGKAAEKRLQYSMSFLEQQEQEESAYHQAEDAIN
ncbi:MAG: hypothetical protein C0594_06600, partial [Marinilabiliales bacterium]